jgi:hypothetical protein
MNTLKESTLTESTLTDKLKKRFCDDHKLSIQVTKEPYFSERVKLLGYENELHDFENIIATKFNNNEQDYFEYYNKFKDAVIDYIKESDAFKALNSDDMNNYAVQTNIRQGDVFKEMYVGEHFISIDIKKANFSALVYYAKENGYVFSNNSYDYREFVSMFTELVDYFADSKYVRQVVFGNCNPKRQITYEKYIMNKVLEELRDKVGIEDDEIITFCNDEIVLKRNSFSDDRIRKIREIVENSEIPLKMEIFKLGRLDGTGVYLKNIYNENNEEEEIEVKCASPVDVVFAYRALKDETITDTDLVINTQYGVAKLLDKPEVKERWVKNVTN